MLANPSAEARPATGGEPTASVSRQLAFLPPYLVVAYFAHGVAQHFCLIAQPLDYYLLKVQRADAADVALFLSILMFPWIVKPAFGALSDLVAICGWHKKSYLVLSFAVAATGFAGVAAAPGLPLLMPMLFATSCAMALSTVVLCALVADASRRRPARSRALFSLQAAAYYAASVAAALTGGFLCQHLDPASALRSAAVCCLIACLPALMFSLRLPEERVLQRPRRSTYWRLVKTAVNSRRFRAVALFTFLWNFSPSFGTPLYFYFTQHLKFSQAFIGQLGAINSLGMLVGAIVFRLVAHVAPCPRRQALIAVSAGVASNISYLLCTNASMAIALEGLRGIVCMFAILTIYGYAADVCPKRIAATTIGILIAVYNVGTQLGALLGANFFTHVAGGMIQPLAVFSAMVTALCLALLRFLPENSQRTGKAPS